MAKKVDYTNIELLFPSELFLKGEELFEKGQVTDINKIEKDLFSFTIREGGGNIEVEWYKPLTKYQKASCECEFFKIGKMCRHVIAALLAYKSEFYKPLEKTIVEEELTPKKFASLNINSVLNQLTKEDLKTFIKSYSQSDKKFATAFKVHFARKVDLKDNEKKYKSILDSIISPITTEKNPYKASNIKAFLSITEEFLGQADDAMAMGQYREAFLLIKTTLSKLCYANHYSTFYNSELEKQILNAHKKLTELINIQNIEELKEEIVVFLHELVELSYYPFISINYNAASILNNLSLYSHELDEKIQSQLTRHQNNEGNLINILATKLVIALSRKEKLELNKKYFLHIDKVAEALLKEKYYKVVIKLYNDTPVAGKDFSIYYLQSLLQTESKKIEHEAAKAFITTKDLRIVEFIKMKIGEEGLAKLRSILEKDYKKFMTNDVFFSNFLLKIDDLSNLLNFLKEKRNFKLLMTFDEYLLERYENELCSLYESMLEEFLNEYIGEQSHKFIEELFGHLNKIKASKIVNKLALLIDLKFSHRTKLEETLKQ